MMKVEMNKAMAISPNGYDTKQVAEGDLVDVSEDTGTDLLAAGHAKEPTKAKVKAAAKAAAKTSDDADADKTGDGA